MRLGHAAIEALEQRTLMSVAIYGAHATVRGLNIGEWSAAWWQWGVSFPNDQRSPFNDATGTLGRLGDVGKVFFLAGPAVNTGGIVHRSIDVPTGKPVLFPVLNNEWSTAETGLTTFSDLLAANKTTLAGITAMHAALDGATLPTADIFSREEISPLFQFNLPANNVLGVPPLPTNPSGGNSVADGFWVMTKPLTKGVHTVSYGGMISGFGDFEATYTLNVVPKGHYEKEPINAATLAALNAAEHQPPLPFASEASEDDQSDWVSAVLK